MTVKPESRVLDEYAEAGMKLVRLSRGNKKAVDRGWPTKTLLLDDAHAWVSGGENIGIQCGEVSEWFCAADLDVPEARALAPYFLPDTLKARKGEEEPSHWSYISEGAGYRRIAGVDDPEIVALKASNDGKGHYIAVGPSIHPSKGAYSWEGGFDFSKITRISSEDLEARVGRLGAATLIARNMPASGKHFYAQHLIGFLLKNREQTEEVLSILRPAWKVCNALSVDADRDLEQLVEDTAEKLQNNEPVSGGGKLGELVTNLPKRIFQALGWSSPDITDGRTRFDLTDPGNADRLIARHGKDVRFVPEWNTWIVWDGRRWRKNEGGHLIMQKAVDTAREIHSEAACEIDQDQQKRIYKHAMASQSKQRLEAMISIARAYLTISPDELDTDPMLLNVNNGTIDLRTGSLRPHNSENLITKLVPTDHDPSAKAPRFKKFLKQTLVEDELIAFMQRYLGYSLTGLTEERVLAVLYGIGKNGKSTLVELFQDLLGDYSSVAHPNTIMQTRYGDATAQYQLAELPGVRFVSMSETKRGVELEEAVVKQITGNDTISARSPYGKPFYYRPQFKLWMSTNHKPEIPDGSEAIWDRIRLIPFNQRFDGKSADPKLPQKLREELPGVLAWAVEGCVEWGQNGLGTSAAVEQATKEYRAETDVIDRFFDDVCVFGPEERVSKKGLFEAWDRWCVEQGEEAGKQVQFSRDMKDRGKVRGFGDKKIKGEWFWKGIGLVGNGPEDGGGETLNLDSNPAPPASQHVQTFPPEDSLGEPSPQRKRDTYAENSGAVKNGGKVSENSGNFSIDPLRVEKFSDNKENLPPTPKPSPQVVTTPTSWTFEGIKIDYMPEVK